jgi:hypothetical protein
MKKLHRISVIAVSLIAIAHPAEAEVAGHCMTRLVPLERVGVVVHAALERIGCFPTYEEALEAGVRNALDLEDPVSPESLDDMDLETLTVATSVVIGTEWTLGNFGGGSESYSAPTTCSSSTTWQVANVGAAWNDQFSSGKGFGGCDTNRKFQHENFGGNVRVCTPNCTDYGTLSNQVTSLRWRV